MLGGFSVEFQLELLAQKGNSGYPMVVGRQLSVGWRLCRISTGIACSKGQQRLSSVFPDDVNAKFLRNDPND